LHDLRQVLAPDDILISDVGAHKVWIAHQWHAQAPNSCIISNGFAAMGIGLPGAIAAKLAFPDRTIVTATGDAFNNPDFVALAESFGACGYRVDSADDLTPTLQQAIACGTVAVVDYTENMRLTERLGRLTCPN
jgi:acetolactate synthase-1/2/3 large subunit